MFGRDSEIVTLKHYKDGMILNINKNVGYDEILKASLQKFKKAKKFLAGTTINLGFEGSDISEENMKKIINEVSALLNTEVTFWEKHDEINSTTEEKLKAHREKLEKETAEKMLSSAFNIDVEEKYTKFYKKTVRSGQYLKSDGHIVIVGDVNPGAEIEAAGNIFVMGTVKGIVHAGARGDRNAIVVALNLSPTQLRIADIITRAPDDYQKDYLEPEMAYIEDGKIFIEEFLQKKK